MFVFQRQNSLLETLKCLLKAVVAMLIFAFEQFLAIVIVPPAWKRDEGQKKKNQNEIKR